MSVTIRAIASWVGVLLVLASSALAAGRDPERIPVRNLAGDYLFIIYLNERLVREADASQEAPPRNSRAAENRLDFRGWHRPTVRALVRRLEQSYGIVAVSMTSWAVPTFAAYVPAERLAELRGDPRVDSLSLSYMVNDYSAWTDGSENGELVSWGLKAVGANDHLSTNNLVYMIDGGFAAQHEDICFSCIRVENPGFGGNAEHALHVAGIIAAIGDNAIGVRGVSPRVPLVWVGKGTSTAQTQAWYDWVLYDAETLSIYPVVNVSQNDFVHAPGGDLYPYIKRLSNRALFVESAGNFGEGTCIRSYGPVASPYDGILVVGGVDETGARATYYDVDHVPGYQDYPFGSSYGPCVDSWAPSTHIYSTFLEAYGGKYQQLSGTSMAAPYVTGIAARYGSNWITSPVEREAFVRSIHVPTGYYAPDGAEIVIPTLTQPPAVTLPRRLRFTGIAADSTMAGSSVANAADEKYLTSSWNSGHVAPAWIEFDLGHSRSLYSIRMTPEIYPPGQTIHEIYAGNAPGPTALVATISAASADLQPLISSLTGVTARYVRIKTTMSPSWVAWREVEVYGYARGDEAFIDWTYAGILDRPPDSGGYAFWLSDLRSTRCLNPGNATAIWSKINSLNSQFVNSPEFVGKNLDARNYVQALYRGILRRNPDEGGLNYWTNQIVGGARTREGVRSDFVLSTEMLNSTINPIVNETCLQ